MNSTLDSQPAVRAASESVPTDWTAADEAFFRVVGDALPATYLFGASVLLASYDTESTHAGSPA